MSLLPESYQTKLMLTLEELVDNIMDVNVDSIKNFYNPQTTAMQNLPYLALFFGVAQWDSGWSEETKRAVLSNAIMVNKKRGTLWALKKALADLKLSATVVEWMEDETLPKGTAKITLHEGSVIYSQNQYNTIYSLISEVKRLSLEITIEKIQSIKGNMFVGGAISMENRVFV